MTSPFELQTPVLKLEIAFYGQRRLEFLLHFER